MSWNRRVEAKLEVLAASLIAGIALVAFFGALGAAAEESPARSEVLLQALAPLSEEDLSAQRGGAVLPGGMSVEVSSLMRVLVDGEDLAASSVAPGFPIGVEPGIWAVIADSGLESLTVPMAITNSENGISIGQFREVNIEIRNIPISLGVAPAFPAEVFSPSVIP